MPIRPPQGFLPDAPDDDQNAPQQPEGRLQALKQGAMGMFGFGNPQSPANQSARVASAVTPFAAVDAAGQAPSALGAMVGNAAKPIARFLGWGDKAPMYTVDAPGHVLHGSTVTPAALQHHGIPFPPPPAAPPGPSAGMMYSPEGIAHPPSVFTGGETTAPFQAAPSVAVPGPTAQAPLPRGYGAPANTPDLPSLLGGKGPGGSSVAVNPYSVKEAARQAARGSNVVQTPRAIAQANAAKPVPPVTPESIASAKAARNAELEGVAKLKNNDRAAAARKSFKAVKGGKSDEEE